ncbi:MAG: beta-lactamase family protein [Alphaproteobacteria bacterium]|nr:beta-lactamase family protein [Alphaproteobacteria bacterium]
MAVHGKVAKGFERVREAFADGQALDEGGAQLCIYRGGERVVDLWTGRDVVNARNYSQDTVTTLMSCSKGAVATCIHILSDRGEIDLEAPVARYWPEFASGGKEFVRIWHLLTHSAGLLGFEPDSGVGAREMLDWETSVNALARMSPLWTPGKAYLYHFVTFGYLLGEVIRRISGKTPGRFLADEISTPLGIDLWIGLPESEEKRVAPAFSRMPAIEEKQWRALFQGQGIDPDTRLAKTLVYAFRTTDELVREVMNTRAGRAAEIPAGNGIGNARALAKMYAAMIGEVDGVRLIRPETMEHVRMPQTHGMSAPADLAKLARSEPQRFGLGYELPRAPEPMLGPGSFGHAGAGGRMGFAHPESGIALGYVCNNMLWNNIEPDARWVPWTKALNEVLS